jgi:hypothetical protein
MATKSKSSTSNKNSDFVKPGTEAKQDMKLYVKDSHGKTIGEVNVPAGHRVPPTRLENAEGYSRKK